MKKQLGLMAMLVMAGCGNVFSPLNSSQPKATGAVPRYPGLVDDFEGGTSVNNFSQANTAYTDGFVYDSTIPNTPPGPSTMTVLSTSGSNLPGGTPGKAMRLMGTVQANKAWNQPSGGGGYTTNNYPFAFMQMTISYPFGIDITGMAPQRQLSFSYLASALDVGQVHRVTIMNAQEQAKLNYEFYIAIFTPATANVWTQTTINFPPLAFSSNPCNGPSTLPQPPFFWPAIFYGNCSGGGGLPAWLPWTYVQTKVAAILFQPFSGASAFTYDFSIDDVRFQ